MRVFIDAVEYIHLFKGEPHKVLLENLEKLIKANRFVLVFPKITCNEVYREIKGEIKNDEQRQVLLFSQIFPEAKRLRSFRDLEDKYTKVVEKENKVLNKARTKIKEEMARKIFDIFQSAVSFDDSEDVLRLAQNRKSKSFPPGKHKDLLGDQLAWEILLSNCKDDDLIIVSADPDWRDLTDLERCKVNPIILKEWGEGDNKNKVELLDNLNDLLKKFDERYKKPEEETEIEKVKSTLALRSTFVPYTSLGSASGTSSLWMSTPESTTTSTSRATSSSIYDPNIVSTTTTLWPTDVCSRCGRLLNSYGPYYVQNGLKFCSVCASTTPY